MIPGDGPPRRGHRPVSVAPKAALGHNASVWRFSADGGRGETGRRKRLKISRDSRAGSTPAVRTILLVSLSKLSLLYPRVSLIFGGLLPGLFPEPVPGVFGREIAAASRGGCFRGRPDNSACRSPDAGASRSLSGRCTTLLHRSVGRSPRSLQVLPCAPQAIPAFRPMLEVRLIH